LIEIYESSPGSTYGGWISTDPLTERHATLLGAYLRKLPNLNWMTNPFDPAQLGAAGEGEATWTRAIDLEGGLQRLSKNARYEHRYAQKKGVVLRPIQIGDLHSVYQIYMENKRRWTNQRAAAYEMRFFALVLNREHVDFLGAFLDDRLVATSIAVRSKRHTAAWLSVSNQEGRDCKAMTFLDGCFVERYAAAGYRWYDMHPSGGLENLDRKKKSTGAASHPVKIVHSKTPLYFATNWAHDQARALLSLGG
jgi:hypothetical protein